MKYFKSNKQEHISPKQFPYAESDKVDKYEEIALDFFEKIIGINYHDCFISNYSSLSDFELDNEETIDKIRAEYGIEPSKDYFLLNIFELIDYKNNKTR